MNGEILAFIVYFVAIVGVGIYFFFKEKGDATQANFFLGGRQMGPWVAAMSAQASDMSAWLLMGLPGSILAFGFGQMWIGIGLALGTGFPLYQNDRHSQRTPSPKEDVRGLGSREKNYPCGSVPQRLGGIYSV